VFACRWQDGRHNWGGTFAACGHRTWTPGGGGALEWGDSNAGKELLTPSGNAGLASSVEGLRFRVCQTGV
jgi:hypothetical protein